MTSQKQNWQRKWLKLNLFLDLGRREADLGGRSLGINSFPICYSGVEVRETGGQPAPRSWCHLLSCPQERVWGYSPCGHVALWIQASSGSSHGFESGA